MIKGTVIREVRFKDGCILLKGTTVIVVWPDPHGKPTQVNVLNRDHSLHCPASTALGWIGLSISEADLVGAVMDGVCETPAGNKVEPDGVDAEGVPSWLRVHGLI